MTDEQTHRMLVEAGARWRSAQPADVREPRVPPPHRAGLRRPTTWLVSAAAIAAGLTALMLVAVTGGNPDRIPTGAARTAVLSHTWFLEGRSASESPGTSPRSDNLYRIPIAQTLILHSNGTVSGHTGCSTFTGKATITDTRIRFGTIHYGIRSCPNPGVAADDAALRRFLRGAAHWSVTCHNLVLSKPDHIALDFYTRRGTNWTRADVKCMQRYSQAHS